MTLVDVQGQFQYWRRHPSQGDLIGIIAQIAGWKPAAPEEPDRKMDLGVEFVRAMHEHAARKASKG